VAVAVQRGGAMAYLEGYCRALSTLKVNTHVGLCETEDVSDDGGQAWEELQESRYDKAWRGRRSRSASYAA
jgi:hypothetical protein